MKTIKNTCWYDSDMVAHYADGTIEHPSIYNHNKSMHIIKSFELDSDKANYLYTNYTKKELMDMLGCSPTVCFHVFKKFIELKNGADFYTHCKNCGKLFKPKGFEAYCSDKCKEESYKKITKDWLEWVKSDEYAALISAKTKIAMKNLPKETRIERARKLWKSIDIDTLDEDELEFVLYGYDQRKEMFDIYANNTTEKISAIGFLDYYNFKHLTEENVYVLFKKFKGLFKPCGDKSVKFKYSRSRKEIRLEESLAKLGFVANDEKFKNTRTVPDFVNHKEKIILDFNGVWWHKDRSFWERWKIIQKDYFEVIRRRAMYNYYGYSYYVIWEDSFEDYMLNPPKTLEELKKYDTIKYSFYVAGGWFSDKQAKTLNKLNDIIDKCNYSSYKPRVNGIDISAEKKKRELSATDFLHVFVENIKSISESRAIFASICENDPGTLYEIAVGQSMGIPVFLFDDTLDGKNVNIMLSMYADGVFTDIKDVEHFLMTGKINQGKFESE